MTSSDDLSRRLSPLARALRPPDDLRRNRRVDRAIDGAGRVIIDPPDFSRQRSPDGSIWRIKVRDDGSIVTAKEPT